MEYDYLYKILVLGDHSVGKSSLIHNYVDFEKLTSTMPTIGIDFRVAHGKDCTDRKIKLHIWDTGGHYEYKHIITSYYKNTAAVVIVYDITNYESFRTIEDILIDLSNYSATNIRQPIILIGNKCDLEDKRQVSKLEAETFAKDNRLLYFETTANDDCNIEYIMGKLIDSISNHYIDNKINHTGVKVGFKLISKDNNICDQKRGTLDCCIPS
tara:strand:- start:2974 stop:3609 length:636 start_codon:yes stop_codon:yes gene_type:complete